MINILTRARARWSDLLGDDDVRRRRLLALLRGSISSLGNKALGMVIALISVPLTINYLGTERYGAWIAIGSLLSWLALSDLGLGSGLTNAITGDASEQRSDRVRMHLSNFMVLMIGIGAIVAAVLAVSWPFVDWERFFGVTDPAVGRELRVALVISFVVLLIRLPMSASSRIFMAYQEGHLSNYWAAAGNVGGLAALLAVSHSRGGLPLLVLALSGVSLTIEVMSVLWMLIFRRPEIRPGIRYVDRTQFHQIAGTGIRFFVITVMALVTFQSDVLVIAHYLGAREVPNYSVANSLFTYANLPQVLLFPYLWSAYNEAISRRDMGWVRKTFRLNIMVGVPFTAMVATVLVFIGQPFIRWWTNGQVEPPFALLVLMGVWIVINAFTNPIACLLAAASSLRWQIIYSAFATVTNIVLSIWLVGRMGVTGVILATVLAYAVFVCGPIYIDARALIRRLSAPR